MKKKTISVLSFLLLILTIVNAQTTIILQPNSAQGKDAYIESRLNNYNFGSHIDFPAISWTNGGIPVNVRGLVDFDLSEIPEGVIINSAKLSLYSYNSPSNGSHSTLSGSNESVLSRVIDPWYENSVNWNNQPATTTQNQAFLPASTNSIQNYLNINVTNLVQDMVADPDNSYGFQIKLVTEECYRRMVFASSDNIDPRLHPKLVVTFSEAVQSDSCIIFRPGAELGKDAYIDSRLNNDNFGNHIDFPAISWTNGGIPVNIRGLVDFDLSEIPEGVIINSASLSLYSFNSSSNGSHSTLSGSNESVLSRVIDPWNENAVNWNNQPATTTQNQAFLPASTSSIQNYLNINVTNLVQDMVADPDNSYGFQIKLVTEEYYRKMIFASSDNVDSRLHPKLVVCYSLAYFNSESEEKDNYIEFNIYPNPTKELLNISINNPESTSHSIEIINSQGLIVKRQLFVQPLISIDISNLASGMYFVKVVNNVKSSTLKKLIIE